VGPPADIAAAFGGGKTQSQISTLRETVQMYASAQPLDFLARTKNASFPNLKLLVSYRMFPVTRPLTCSTSHFPFILAS